MTEEKLIDHIISRLEPHILDYVDVRNPQTTSNLLQIIDKYEERFLNRIDRGSSWKSRDINPNENNRFSNRNRQENWREMRGNNRYADNSRPWREFNRFESQGVADNQRFDGRRRGGQSYHRFHNQGGRQGGSRNSAFRGQNVRNRYLNFSAIDATLWDTGVENSFISEEVYRKYFWYRPCQKRKDRVVTAQGAPCCHLDRIKLQIQVRELQKIWEFHILNNMQFQCILGIDFMKESKLTLDFDQKSLIIPDTQLKQLQTIEKPVEFDLSDTKLGEGQKQKLRNLFNGFKWLFSYQPGLTHVLYHEIDTADKRPVVSRPYRYDRVKQGIMELSYHIEKMLQEEAHDAFDKIKLTITEAPVLQLPNFTEQFNLFTDASEVGIGAVLNKNNRPIAFASRTLNKAERNYTVTECECLAVIWALNNFKTYFGSLPVKVITDHAALTKLTNGKNLSSRMIRYALKLSEFNTEWEHRPGVQNVVADVLSRNPVGNLDGSQISCAAL
ncbi:retrovirus-related Pol polyprotein from transposon opus [Trichonephila clavipes]|uniref:Retrovirus-related Pol polyprotein from transposon opus n=1 Tax=Trichonephila clavipes TaxID=2585209 RepID=A0A8X6SPZ0_TRICX|nr:retrovirus-related Pol polyprotein from transposon opus [Trichonephila clavipes]